MWPAAGGLTAQPADSVTTATRDRARVAVLAHTRIGRMGPPWVCCYSRRWIRLSSRTSSRSGGGTSTMGQDQPQPTRSRAPTRPWCRPPRQVCGPGAGRTRLVGFLAVNTASTARPRARRHRRSAEERSQAEAQGRAGRWPAAPNSTRRADWKNYRQQVAQAPLRGQDMAIGGQQKWKGMASHGQL